MSEIIKNTLRMGLPASFLRALVPQSPVIAETIKVNAEPRPAPVIDRSSADAGGSADQQLHAQLRSMAALHHARTAQAQDGSTQAA